MLSPAQLQAARAKYGIDVPSQEQKTLQNRQGSFSEQVAAKREALKPKLGQGAAGEFSGNVLRSVGSFGVRTGAAIESGLDETLGRVGNIIGGKGNVPTQTGKKAFEMADKIDEGRDRTLAGDLGTAVGTVAPYLIGPGEAELGAGLLAKGAKVVGNIAKNTAIGTGQTGDIVEGLETGIGGEVLGAAGAPIKALAKGAYKALAVPTSKAEARLIQTYKADTPFLQRFASALKGESKGPVTADDTAFRKGLFGTESMIGTQAKRASKNLWKDAIKPSLDRSKVKVDMPKFFDAAEQKIVSETPELSRQKDLLEALKALREDYDGVHQVSLAKLQDFKKGWAANVPQKAYQGKDIAGAFSDVKNIVAGQARQDIYNALGPDIRQAYIDHGNLQSLAEWGQTAMTGSKFKGGTGGLLNAAKDAILTPVATVGGHTLYKVAGGLEFVGPPGARFLVDLFNEGSQN